MKEADRLELMSIKNDVLAVVNMVEFIQDEYNVYLQPRANGWYETSCLMPNHRDENPSFGVNPEIGRYRCLSCGAKGDLIELVKVVEGLSFTEALLRLADYAGISVDKSADARLGRMVKQMARDVQSYLDRNVIYPFPAQMSEPVFMLAVADRLKKYERATQDHEWVEGKYTELDDMLEAEDYKGCERFWSTLSDCVKNRRRELQTNE
ncbi:MAG: hypothetical protein JSS66_05315 [Armatimonadetes bacterium]|nr:hypothetical protein [Armatimonadota bacterium]